MVGDGDEALAGWGRQNSSLLRKAGASRKAGREWWRWTLRRMASAAEEEMRRRRTKGRWPNRRTAGAGRLAAAILSTGRDGTGRGVIN